MNSLTTEITDRKIWGCYFLMRIMMAILICGVPVAAMNMLPIQMTMQIDFM